VFGTAALTSVEVFDGAREDVLGVGMAEELDRAEHKQAAVVAVSLTGQVLEGQHRHDDILTVRRKGILAQTC